MLHLPSILPCCPRRLPLLIIGNTGDCLSSSSLALCYLCLELLVGLQGGCQLLCELAAACLPFGGCLQTQDVVPKVLLKRLHTIHGSGMRCTGNVLLKTSAYPVS